MYQRLCVLARYRVHRIGGGFRASRVGELAIARTWILLREADVGLAIKLLHNYPNEDRLIGTVHLLPPWMVKGHDAMLAVDIGGTNIRAGVVKLQVEKQPDLSEAYVQEKSVWRHRDLEHLGREDAVGELAKMLKELVEAAGESKLTLAPVIGIGLSHTRGWRD